MLSARPPLHVDCIHIFEDGLHLGQLGAFLLVTVVELSQCLPKLSDFGFVQFGELLYSELFSQRPDCLLIGFLNTLSAEFSFPFEELFFALKTLQLLCQVGLDREEVP